MSASKFTPSSKRNPCPICGREKDGSCSIGAEMVCCHRGATHHPPEGLRPGDVIEGQDGRKWAYTGESKDDRCGVFTLDKPRSPDDNEAGSSADPPKTKTPRQKRQRSWIYTDRDGNPLIKVLRADDGNGGKRIWQESLVAGKRPAELISSVVPYGLHEALQALQDGAAHVFWVEGEPCVDVLRELGLPAVTSIGGAGKFRHDRDSGLFPSEQVVVCPDRDQKGIEHGQAVAAAYPGCRWLLAFPDSPEWNGSCPASGGLDVADWIEQEGLTAEQLVAAVTDKGPVAPEKSDSSIEPSPSGAPKRRTLAPDEVLALLPQRLGGVPRLNLRTNEFHVGERTYSANDVERLYLHISNETERWLKETTADAFIELSRERAFDPVEEYLVRTAKEVKPLPMEQWLALDQHLLGTDDPVARAFLPQFFIAAVARIVPVQRAGRFAWNFNPAEPLTAA